MSNLDIEDTFVTDYATPSHRTVSATIAIGDANDFAAAVPLLIARIAQVAGDDEGRVVLKAEFSLVIGQGPARVVCNAVVGWAL